MTNSASDKRWAIVPPPSPESSALSDDFHIDPYAGSLASLVKKDGAESRARAAARGTQPELELEPVPASEGSSPRAVAARVHSSSAHAPESAAHLTESAHSRLVPESAILALEPADSELMTERPPASVETTSTCLTEVPAPHTTDAERSIELKRVRRERSQEAVETIPAPSWVDEDPS